MGKKLSRYRRCAKKALLLKEKGLAKDDVVFTLLDGAFATHKTSFTDYNVLELYFNLYLDRYKTGEKNITQDDFIAKIWRYGRTGGLCAGIYPK